MANLKEIAKKVHELRNIKSIELLQLLEKYSTMQFKIRESQYIIVHPSTREDYKYQISTFDSLGAIMDGKYNSINEVLEQLLKGIGYNKKTGDVYYRYELMEVVR